MSDAFRARQRRTGEWISWWDIAEQCARAGQPTIRANGGLQNDAYRQLAQALERGDFDDEQGRTRVRYMAPHAERGFRTPGLLTRDIFAALPECIFTDLIAAHLQHCWIPAEMARRWFLLRGRPVPEALFVDAPERAAETVGANDNPGERARRWMLAKTENQPVPPKRDTALEDCRRETGCTYRQALAAWDALPPDRKRTPRQTDRALRTRAR